MAHDRHGYDIITADVADEGHASFALRHPALACFGMHFASHHAGIRDSVGRYRVGRSIGEEVARFSEAGQTKQIKPIALSSPI